MKWLRLWLLLALVLEHGCTKDKTAAPQNSSFTCDSTLTYSNTVKTILDSNCALSGCHLGFNSSGIVMGDYDNAKISFAQGNAFCTVQHGLNCKPMPYPQGAAMLSDALIGKLQCWASYGYKP